MTKISILAISGSLRSNSSSNLIMKAMIALASKDIAVTICKDIGNLPHFDDSDPAPAAVIKFRSQLKEAHGVLICTPEYAFGVPGSLKNALDWTVSSGDFVDKPVALVTASSGGEHAHASLQLTLKAISSKIAEGGTLLISFVRAKIDREGHITDPTLTNALQEVMNAFITTIKSEQS